MPSAVATAPSPARLAGLFWLLPLILASVQAVYVHQARHLMRYEEVAESVRSPYWLAHGEVYDGISSNVSWYALLALTYEIVGFELETARWVRWALYLVSAFSLAWLLRRRLALPPIWASLPLLAWGLSPSLLLFDTIATTYAFDLLLLPCCLGVLGLVSAGGRSGPWSLATDSAFAALTMAVVMAYPVVLFSLPVLALLYWRRLGSPKVTRLPWRRLVSVAVGFGLPLVLALATLRPASLLVYDHRTGSGIFRGGGKTLAWDPEAVAKQVERVRDDLLVRGKSYYFAARRPELGGWMARIGISAAAVIAAAAAIRRRQHRLLLGAIVVMACVNLLLPAQGQTGLRRATGVVAAGLAVYGLACWFVARYPPSRRIARVGPWLLLALLPIHHLHAAWENRWVPARISHRQQQVWLRIEETPQMALERWLDHTAAGLPLDCRDIGVPPESCQYSDPFALLSGYRDWNDLPPVRLIAWDPAIDNYRELDRSLWREWVFPH